MSMGLICQNQIKEGMIVAVLLGLIMNHHMGVTVTHLGVSENFPNLLRAQASLFQAIAETEASRRPASHERIAGQ